jgi:hypothetical protein
MVWQPFLLLMLLLLLAAQSLSGVDVNIDNTTAQVTGSLIRHHRIPRLRRFLGSILQNSISAEKFK